MAAAAKTAKKSTFNGPRHSSTAVDTNSLLAATNIMRLSNYQNDPLAAMMHTRSIGFKDVVETQIAQDQDRDLFKMNTKAKKYNDRN